MLRLDYISCVLTVLSTLMVGRRMWYGWVVAGMNSVIICAIALKTGQFGFVPANLFCLGLYVYNIVQWRKQPQAVLANGAEPVSFSIRRARGHRLTSRRIFAPNDEYSTRKRDRVHRSGV
jgi:hypothetical protein